MKELSVEEKAKRYDKALEIINDYYQKIKYSSLSNASTDIEILERAFSELKDLKNEKIRKRIIALVNAHGQGMYKDEMLAWLEKQGEQKPQGKSALEASKEEKVDNANKVEPKDYSSIDPHFFKPAWSEEDDVAVKDICDKLNRLSMTYVGNESIVCQEEIKWLKSLRPQSTWKPSDEQMETLEHFVRNVGESGYASPYDNNTKLLYSLLSDLKKLKE